MDNFKKSKSFEAYIVETFELKNTYLYLSGGMQDGFSIKEG